MQRAQPKRWVLITTGLIAMSVLTSHYAGADDSKPSANAKTEESQSGKIKPNTDSASTEENTTSDPIRPNPQGSEDQDSAKPSTGPVAPITDLTKAIAELAATVDALREEIKSPKSGPNARSIAPAGQDIPSEDDPATQDNNPLTSADAAVEAGGLVMAASINYPIRVASSARKIHLIHFALTNDPTEKLDQGSRANVKFLNALFTKMTENCNDRLKITTIQGNDMTTPIVDKTLSNLSDVTQQDTLVVYFSTHGGFDPKRNEHFFQTMNKGLYSRKRVWDRINGKARLTAVFSDACTSYLDVPRSVAGIETPVKPKYAIFDLLFYYRGTVNISSSTYPNPSYYVNVNSNNGGGAFTRQFVNASVYASVVSESAGQSQGWQQFFTDSLRGPKPIVVDSRRNEVPVWFLNP